MIVVDSSVWIDAFRGNDTAEVGELRRRLEDDERLAITDVILTELLQGARSERDVARLEAALSAHDVYRLEALDDFRRAASLYRTARRAGETIGRTTDCLIASVCIREDLPLLHADADFSRLAACTSLRVVAPTR